MLHLDLLSSAATGSALGALALALLGPARARSAGSRRRRAAWLAATRSCRRAFPLWLLLAIGTGLGANLLATVAGPGAIGAQLLLRACRIEARGRIGTGRALARLGGQILFFGAAAVAVLGGPAHVVAALVVALGGSAALLAGLAGKPRPSGPVAVALYGLGVVSLLVL